MHSKVFLLLLGAALAVANPEYQQDAAIIRNYFLTQDQASLNVQWDVFLKNTWTILQRGKIVGIQQAGLGQVEKAVREWIEVEKLQIVAQAEARAIVESVRGIALAKAPQEWNMAIKSTIDLFAVLRSSAATGSAQSTTYAIIQLVNNLRQIKVNIRQIAASRKY